MFCFGYERLRYQVMNKIPKVDRQREHQANERTFLAWLRTSIAFIGFGFAIARFGLFLRQLNFTVTQQEPPSHAFFNSENLGIALVIFGIMTIAFAAWRYNQAYWQIEKGDYRPMRYMVWVIAGIVMLFGFFSLPLLIMRNTVPPSQRKLTPSQSRNWL
ncbi:MAG: hypothetical protein KatS3mg066_2082 [Fischerella sp.]|nr:MAG: hypothetical protein KatS3mg066_2082 [Fischerella sp.]